MKKQFVAGIIVALLAACQSEKPSSGLITIDVTGNHPELKLTLQDLLDVEYIALETTDDFLTQGGVESIGEKYIVVRNWHQDGDIFFFDRQTGRAIRKINRKGEGSEEYSRITKIILDEVNNELFVGDLMTSKILVYDLEGVHKRTLKLPEDCRNWSIYPFNNEHLIAYDHSATYNPGSDREDKSYHLIFSKKDGNIVKGIYIPYEKVKSLMVEAGNNVAVPKLDAIAPHKEDFFFTEPSSDTVYYFNTKNQALTPYLVKESTSKPEKVLKMGVVTNRYCVMSTTEIKFDFSKGSGFPISYLVYDKQTNRLHKASVSNADFINGQQGVLIENLQQGDIAAIQVLQSHRLVEAYESGKIQNETLKKIVSGLNEESNPVIMIMKHKKADAEATK
ncbi:MAG: 6-bladed beta-propeller [Mediterranea massiliensis]|nr:6-bladed beta-propeller [Mediterranea massiliensis]